MRVFLAEHDVTMIDLIRSGLTNVSDALDVQQSGDVALYFLMKDFKLYDLVILDAALPKVDGEVVCSRVKEKDVGIPILMLVAPNQLQPDSPALTCGADEYLVKPFTVEELRFRATSLLHRGTILLPALVKLNGFMFNVRERSLTYANTTIALTTTESALLENLIQRPNEVLSREEILRLVWGDDAPQASNLVDVHIKNLRKKLRPFKRKGVMVKIESVRGKGYRFKEANDS